MQEGAGRAHHVCARWVSKLNGRQDACYGVGNLTKTSVA